MTSETANQQQQEPIEDATQHSEEISDRTFSGDEWARFCPGELWGLQGEHVVIQSVASLDELLVKKVVSGQCILVKRGDLKPVSMGTETGEAPRAREEHIPEEIVARAKTIECALAPYLNGVPLRRPEKEKLAAEFGVDPRTVRRWLRAYRHCRHWTAFVKNLPGTKPGSVTLSEEAEAIIDRAIREHMKHHEDITVNAIEDVIKKHCLAINIKIPSPGTIRARIQDRKENDPDFYPAHVRQVRNRATKMSGGSIDMVDALNPVQIDHTPVNVTVEHPITGKCIGSPWLTLVFAVKPRVVLGFALTLEAPSQLSTALALHHAVFPKEEWLARIGANGPWPFYGIMSRIHMDNASEFKSDGLKAAAARWNIKLAWRRIAHPEDGAHIERFIGTLMGRMKLLRGSTYSLALKKKVNGKKSGHTLASLTTWIANEITAYHHHPHTTLGMTPAAAWEQAFTTSNGLRLPIYPKNERDFLVSFLPQVHRVVTREGIEWERLTYRSKELEPYIQSLVKKPFRYDPRDLSRIYFEPDDKPHFEVPWVQTQYPPLSLWEWRELRPHLKAKPRPGDASVVHEAREANRALIVDQARTSQRARRRDARELNWKDTRLPNVPAAQPPLRTEVASLDTSYPFEILE